MSRTGSFPMRVPLKLLQDSRAGSVVLDPFCGKGTSLLAARLLGLKAFGSDVAPEAVLCSATRLTKLSLSDVLEFLEDLDLSNADFPVPESVALFFHPDVLRQLLQLRAALLARVSLTQPDPDDPATVALVALLGILHGRSESSLSIPSAHAFSMSPGYVARYAAAKGLTPPKRDVIACLNAKLVRCFSAPMPRKTGGAARLGSAVRMSEVFPELVGKVDVVLTSPPYLDAQTYAKDNWLRLWLLGLDYRALRSDYIETGSVSKYSLIMADVFTQVHAMLRKRGRLVCIAGDVRLRNGRSNGEISTIKTGELLRDVCSGLTDSYEVEMVGEHVVPSWNRYFHALSGSNGHRARPMIERVFVARKG